MCLTRPCEVIAVSGDRATVRLDAREIVVDTRPIGPVAPGDCLLVHAGLALERIDREVALELANLFAEVDEA